jgi:HPt (histidine-containing phosphotransfer) domain-containing protein
MQIAGIDVDAGLRRMSGNSSLYNKILIKFYDKYIHVVEEIKQSIAQGNIDEAKGMAHTLKGTSGNISAVELSQAAATVEQLCMKNDLSGLTSALVELNDAHQVVMSGLSTFANEQGKDAVAGSSQCAAGDVSTLINGLSKIMAALDSNIGVALDECESLAGSLAGSSLMPKFIPIQESLSQFDIDLVKTKIEQLQQELSR